MMLILAHLPDTAHLWTSVDGHTHTCMHSHLCLCTEMATLTLAHTHAHQHYTIDCTCSLTHICPTHMHSHGHTRSWATQCLAHPGAHANRGSIMHTHAHTYKDMLGHTFIHMHIPAHTCEHLYDQTLTQTQTGHFWVQTGGEDPGRDSQSKQLQLQRLGLSFAQKSPPPHLTSHLHAPSPEHER